MCRERRAPQNVMNTATNCDRDVKAGDNRQYSHVRSTNPAPQHTSAILASWSFTLSAQTRVDAIRIAPRPASAIMMPVTIASSCGETARQRSFAAALGPLRDRAEHPAEDRGVHRKEPIPVDEPEQSGWFEYGGLVDERARTVRHHLELEPRAARHLHFRREPQPSVRYVRLYPPEVQGVADGRRVRIAPPAA